MAALDHARWNEHSRAVDLTQRLRPAARRDHADAELGCDPAETFYLAQIGGVEAIGDRVNAVSSCLHVFRSAL